MSQLDDDSLVLLIAACLLFSSLVANYLMSFSVMRLFASISKASSGDLILPKTYSFYYGVRSILGIADLMAKIC